MHSEVPVPFFLQGLLHSSQVTFQGARGAVLPGRFAHPVPLSACRGIRFQIPIRPGGSLLWDPAAGGVAAVAAAISGRSAGCRSGSFPVARPVWFRTHSRSLGAALAGRLRIFGAGFFLLIFSLSSSGSILDLFPGVLQPLVSTCCSSPHSRQRSVRCSPSQECRHYLAPYYDTANRSFDQWLSVVVGLAIVATYVGLLSHKWLGYLG